MGPKVRLRVRVSAPGCVVSTTILYLLPDSRLPTQQNRSRRVKTITRGHVVGGLTSRSGDTSKRPIA